MTATLPYGQAKRKYSTLQAERGRELSIRLRVEINAMREQGKEPLRIWLLQTAADCIHACWIDVCGRLGVSYYDGTIPAIAGVPVCVGSTGGQDYAFEMYAVPADAEKLRAARGFKVSDNPLHGTH